MRAPTRGRGCPERVCSEGLRGRAAVGGRVIRRVPSNHIDQGRPTTLDLKAHPSLSAQIPGAGSHSLLGRFLCHVERAETVSDVPYTCAVRLGPQLTQRECTGREGPAEDALTGEIIQNNEM